MSEAKNIPPVGETPADGYAHDWLEIIESMSAQMQLDRAGEGEGWNATEEFIVKKVFELEPEQSPSLYTALSKHPDPYVRLKAVDGLDKLASIDPETSKAILEKLMQDPDEMVRGSAHHIATQYG